MILADVRWIDLQHQDDERGTLTVVEGSALPFAIRRVFYMHRTPPDHDRGSHAHRHTRQCAIATAGSFTMELSDGEQTASYVLDDPNRALYMPPMTWVHMRAFQPGTVALVLCDTAYDPQHVIRSWDEYRRLVSRDTEKAPPPR